MAIAPPAVPPAVDVEPVARRSRLRRLLGVGPFLLGRLFGFVALVVGLAVTTTVPGLQPLVFGYLLEVSGRVGRSGRLRDGLIGLSEAGRLGSIVAATVVCFLPAIFLSSLATDALVIEPNGPTARRTTILLYVVLGLTLWHVVGALLRGGRVRNFLWPRPIETWRRLRRPGTLSAARDAVWDVVARMQLPYFYGLGFRTAIGTLIWLVPPVTVMFLGREQTPAAFVGGLLTAAVLAWLPWLQTQSAVEGGGFRRLFAVGDVRHRFRRGPWASAAALVVALATALPLYLLKIELIPREAVWLPSIVFVLFALPARFALGRAYAYAERRTAPRRRIVVWPARLLVVVATIAYVFVTYLSQTTSWYGRYSLYEQHVVLFPVPFWQPR